MATGHIASDSAQPDSATGQPAWDLALLYPLQGQWGEFDYLAFTVATNRLIEFTDGHVEVQPTPTSSHQRIVLYLLAQLQAFSALNALGEVLCAPLRVKIRDGKFREPDLVFMRAENSHRIGEEYWDRADLVMEVVSHDAASRKRDLQQKPLDYAEGNIPEYWIVDPETKTVTVLALDVQSKAYRLHGEFRAPQQATSATLSGFSIPVAAAFQSALK